MTQQNDEEKQKAPPNRDISQYPLLFYLFKQFLLLNILMISRYLRRACCGEKKPYLADPSNTQDTCHMNLASDGFAQH